MVLIHPKRHDFFYRWMTQNGPFLDKKKHQKKRTKMRETTREKKPRKSNLDLHQIASRHSKFTQEASTNAHLLHTFMGWNVDFDRFFISKTRGIQQKKGKLFYTKFGQSSSHFGWKPAYFCILLLSFALRVQKHDRKNRKKSVKKTKNYPKRAQKWSKKKPKIIQSDRKKAQNDPKNDPERT